MTTRAPGGAVSRFFRLQPVTAWLVAANLAVYAATAAQAGSLVRNNASALFEATALYPPLVVAWDQWWRLGTSAFQHFGPVHLLLNMYMLWILGLGIERSIGHLRFLALYLVSALGGSVAVMAFSPDALTAGASGAIFGLMGAYAVVAVALRLDARGIGLLVALNIGVSFLVPGVSLAAHLGGLVVGALGALVLVALPRRLPTGMGRRGRETVSWAGFSVVVALVAGAAWAAAVTLSAGVVLVG